MRFPEFSGEWEEHQLRNVCKLLSGGTPALDISCYWNGNIPFISATAMHKPYIIDSEQYLSEEGLVHGSKLLKQGNLLLLVRGSMLWKRIPVCYNRVDVAFNQDVKGIIPNNVTNSLFLLYWFLSQENRIKYMVTGTGIGAGKLDMEDLLSMKILLPLQDEQRKVVSLLQLIDARIATQNKIIEDLKKLKSAIVDNTFTNDAKSCRKQILLSDISTKITRKNTDNQISNVLSNSANQGVVPQSEVFDREIANEDSTSNYFVISQNDFVYNPRKSVTAPYGPINKYNGELDGVISPLYLCFRTHDIDVDYLVWYFKSRSWYEYVYKNGDSGVRHDRVSIKDNVFFSMPLNIHSAQGQKEIAKHLNVIERFVRQEEQYLSLIQSQKDYLLQQMFI